MVAATETDTGVDTSILDRMDDLDELRPFPTVATRVMTACQDPNSSSGTIAQVIQSDPGLSLRLLQMSNSSLYGFSGAIRTVEHAIVVLGFRQVRELVLSLAGNEMFSQGTTAIEQRAALWQHSLGCATVARALAQTVADAVPDEAFLAGIFHDVGKLVFYDLAADQYLPLTAAAQPETLVAAELGQFGISHPQVGQFCGESWGLFEEINQAIAYHHNPQDADDHAQLVTLVCLANQLCKQWQIGSETEDAAAADELLLEQLQIETAGLADIETRAREEYQEFRQLGAG